MTDALTHSSPPKTIVEATMSSAIAYPRAVMSPCVAVNCATSGAWLKPARTMRTPA